MNDQSQQLQPPTHPISRVYFRAKFDTYFGERVFVTGDDQKLGDWTPVKGHQLVAAAGVPCWYSEEPVALPLKSKISYKYVMVDNDGNVARWEDASEDRTLIPTGEHMVQEDDNGEFRDYIPLPLTTPDDGGGEVAAESAVRQAPQTLVVDELRALHNTEFAGSIDERDTVLLVSTELPIKVVRKSDEESTFQVVKQKYLFLPMLHQLRTRVALPVKFIGWPGIHVETNEEKQMITDLLESHSCIPVFPPPELFDQYLTFCHGFLWSTFHNIHIYNVDHQAPFNTEQWNAYQSVNRLWAEIVVHNAHETDLIWINDYPLLLTAQHITRRIRRANVGFFLHTPFPSSEIFRCLPVCEEILRGMLCADLVGFQFFEYARHFLVACKRLLGLDHHFRLGGFLAIEYSGRSVSIKIGHVHIQYADLRQFILESPLVDPLANHIRQNYDGKFIFASVDRCDPLSGLILKMRAFQHFLRNYPYARNRAVLIQYAYPIVGPWDDSAHMRHELEELVAKINEEFAGPVAGKHMDFYTSDGTTPVSEGYSSNSQLQSRSPSCGDCDLNETNHHIVLYIKPVTAEEKYSLFRASDCLLDTSIKDGLNLNPFDYICCRHDYTAEIILSEFTGSSRALVSAIRVNPWKTEAVAATMDKAMNTQFQESRDKLLRDQNYLQINSTLGWAEDFLRELRRARKQDDVLYVSWGFANTYRVLGLDCNFRHLDLTQVVSEYRKASRRVLFFDHEGTLAADRRRVTAVPGCDNLFAQGNPPSEHVKLCLETLTADPRNTVVILSGRDQNLLQSWFGAITGIGLCAEHGYYFTVPKVSGNEWVCTSKQSDFTWKHIATELMQNYVRRTQGAIIENKGSALVFQYRDADMEFGSWQAKELSSHLIEMMFGYPVTVMSGKGYVEVKLSRVNKGRAVQTVLTRLKKYEEKEGQFDFVLCIGDDRTDEEMFSAVQEMCGPGHSSGQTEEFPSSPLLRRLSQKRQSESGNAAIHEHKDADVTVAAIADTATEETTVVTAPTVYTVTVGKKPSNAKFYVNDVDEVSELLNALRHVKEKVGVANRGLFTDRAQSMPEHLVVPRNISAAATKHLSTVARQSVSEFFKSPSTLNPTSSAPPTYVVNRPL